MIWSFFPISKLQKMVGEHTLDALSVVLPFVDDTAANVHFLNDKVKLGQLANSFADEDYFRNRNNLTNCLYFLPEPDFNRLCARLNLEPDRASEVKIIEKLLRSRVAFQEFAEEFEIDRRFWPRERDVLEPMLICSPPSSEKPCSFVSPFKRLKNYQNQVFEDAKTALFPINSRLVVQMPTGSGKTRTAMELISEFFLSSDKPETVIWLANSSELCEQALQCFNETWRFIGNTDVAVHRCWGGLDENINERVGQNEMNFIVCSFQTAWPRLQKNNFPSEHCGLLIVDEAHIAVAETYKKSIEAIQRSSNCRVLGLTATPGRSDGIEAEALAGLFQSKLVRLQDPQRRFDNAITFLRSQNVLSTVEYIELQSGIEVHQEGGSEGDYSDKLLKFLGAQPQRLQLVVQNLRPYLNEGKKVILFAPSKQASRFFASMFSYLGFDAAHIDGVTPALTRRTTIREFNEQKIQIISNYGVLATGFDSPKVDLVCLARPTKSAVLYSQMIGRGLRGPAVGGTEHCTVLEVRDNFLGMAMETDLYEIFSDYWS